MEISVGVSAGMSELQSRFSVEFLSEYHLELPKVYVASNMRVFMGYSIRNADRKCGRKLGRTLEHTKKTHGNLKGVLE